ncbi:MAG: phosphoribosylformylglycinamidine cyclo-ligase [Actinomycetota bacterium]|nr:phosphoribosylformylglycinamidine cyclo-ligase [Actinomycetota bacterium]
MAESYEQAGVRGQGEALSSIVRHLGPTLGLPDGDLLTRFGQYASVLRVRDDLAIAITTDGVGSKTLIASALDRYDTIGFDCVAMNVNDVICVGARPLAMVDYLGVHTLDPRRSDEILRGLGAAAKEAGIAIPGGELAQLPEVIGSDGSVPGDPKAFDLVGTCIGTLRPDELITGTLVTPGDAIIGLRSSGIHSNGLTLARRVLLGDAGFGLEHEVAELGRTIGEELLEPTTIYVRAVTALWDAGVGTPGLVHVTSDGFANLCRLDAPVGYRIEQLPPRPPIFDLVQSTGGIADAEMYPVFNMGIGFVVVVSEIDETAALATLEAAGYDALRIGTVTEATGEVEIVPASLVGTLESGESRFRAASGGLGRRV